MFKCGFRQCNFNSNANRDVLQHTLLAHSNYQNFKTKCCFPNCFVTFKTWQKYFSHVENFRHDGNIEVYNRVKCALPDCTVIVSNLETLKRHIYSQQDKHTK